MRVNRRLRYSLAFIGAGLLLSGLSLAQDIPLRNWPVTGARSGGRTALADLSGPLPFVPITPCRQYDSRSFTPLPDNTPRSVTLTGAPCGILSSADAVSVNITVFSITGAGSNGVFKVDTVSPPVTAWINYPPTETQRGNAGVVSLTGGAIWVQVNQGAGSVHFTVDVNGYFFGDGNHLNAGESFFISGTNSSGAIIRGQNLATNSTSWGGLFETYGTADFATGVRGWANGTTGAVYGVRGYSASIDGNAAGVHGSAGDTTFASSFGAGPSGVRGQNAFSGVVGFAQDRAVVGVLLDASGTYLAEGQLGKSGPNPGGSYGVFGISTGTVTGSVGVKGVAAGGLQGASTSEWYPSGVQGEGGGSYGIGVTGVSNIIGVRGYQYTTAGVQQQGGYLGYNPSGTTYWGVYAEGNVGASGTKPFVEPHPFKAGSVIRYVALEGPEAGTYFRGRGRFVGGAAVIEVPESFRLVTDQEGLTVQITPIGRAAAVGVVSMDLNQIVAESTRDLEFSYLVQGVRKAFKDWQVVVESGEFMPESPSARIPAYLSEQQKQYLIDNGTYNADGTVNVRTAERLGWTQIWAARDKQPEISKRGSSPR